MELQGKELLQSTCLARSWKKGGIINELETKDGTFILECAKCEMRNLEFIQVAGLIGEVLGHFEQPLSDAWVEYRIPSLISLGYFHQRGNTHVQS